MTCDVQVIDLETSIKNRGVGAIGKMKASPHAPQNDIVWSGVLNAANGIHKCTKNPTRGNLYNMPPKIIVGQNIGFDLLYLMRDKQFRDVDLPKTSIWDTMLVEYLITGQQSKMTSLDKLAIKYGGEVKDDRLKELWQNDVDTEDIDDSLIEPYLLGDLENTSIVFQGQLAKVNELGIMPLIKSQMYALLATTEMEFNGMYFTKGQAMFEAGKMAAEIHKLEIELIAYMSAFLPKEVKVQPSSATQVSLVLFGGDIIVKRPVSVCNAAGEEITYKSGPRKGQVKTRLESVTERVSGIVPLWHGKIETKRKGTYIVNDEVLQALGGVFCDNLVEYRGLTKDLSTYYIGYSDLVWPHDNCIHPNYNHCITATGRLSHSAPNVGNTSHKK